MTRLIVADEKVCLAALAERVAARPRLWRVTLTIAPDDERLQPTRLNLSRHAVRPALEQEGVELVRKSELVRNRSKCVPIDHECVGTNVNVGKFRKPRVEIAQALIGPCRANKT